jgi:hypothetical protein
MVGSRLGSLQTLWIYSQRCASKEMALICRQVIVVLATSYIAWRLEWPRGWLSRIVSMLSSEHWGQVGHATICHVDIANPVALHPPTR